MLKLLYPSTNFQQTILIFLFAFFVSFVWQCNGLVLAVLGNHSPWEYSGDHMLCQGFEPGLAACETLCPVLSLQPIISAFLEVNLWLKFFIERN